MNRFYPKTQLSWLARLDHSHCNSAYEIRAAAGQESELNSPRSRDETSRASPAVIQAGARRATRGRIGYSDFLRTLSYYYYNGYAAVAALAGASFEIVANMTRPDPCAV